MRDRGGRTCGLSLRIVTSSLWLIRSVIMLTSSWIRGKSSVKAAAPTCRAAPTIHHAIARRWHGQHGQHDAWSGTADGTVMRLTVEPSSTPDMSASTESRWFASPIDHSSVSCERKVKFTG